MQDLVDHYEGVNPDVDVVLLKAIKFDSSLYISV